MRLINRDKAAYNKVFTLKTMLWAANMKSGVELEIYYTRMENMKVVPEEIKTSFTNNYESAITQLLNELEDLYQPKLSLWQRFKNSFSWSE